MFAPCALLQCVYWHAVVNPSLGLYRVMSAFVALIMDGRLPCKTEGLVFVHLGSKQLSVSIRNYSTSAASPSHLDPDQQSGALANSLVDFSLCLPYLLCLASHPISLYSLSSYTLFSVCPVADIIFNTQTHQPGSKKSPSHKGHSSHYIYCSNVKIHNQRRTLLHVSLFHIPNDRFRFPVYTQDMPQLL